MSPKIFKTQTRQRLVNPEAFIKPSPLLMKVNYNGDPQPDIIKMLVNRIMTAPIYLSLDEDGLSYTAIGRFSNDFVASIEYAMETYPDSIAKSYGLSTNQFLNAIDSNVNVVIVEWGPDRDKLIKLLDR